MTRSLVFRAVIVAGIAWSGACNRAGQHTEHAGSERSVELAAQGGRVDSDAERALRDADRELGVERYAVPVSAAQPVYGPADALVTVVVFSDFQCPFCSRVVPSLHRLLRDYPTDVRVVWRNLPLGFHPNAMPAAEAAMEALAQGGDERFWELHDLLFQHQEDLSRERLDRFAAQVGLDLPRYHAAMNAHTHRPSIEEDARLAEEFGVSGTPNSFVNGIQVMGAQPYEVFQELVDAELAHARRFVQVGTPRAEVYAAVTRDGLTQPPPPPPAPRYTQPDAAAVYRVPLEGSLPQRGPSDALVTVVVFSDFQCPFCSRAEPTLTRLLETYGPDLRVVWMNNPLAFHVNALPAAIAAQEAFEQGGDAMFWALHAKLFEQQGDLSREAVERMAQEVGVERSQLRAALDQGEHVALIERQQQLAQGLGALGTPNFFINGRSVRGAVPFETFVAVIDEELARARTILARGVPRAGVYAEAIRDGATAEQTVEQPEAADWGAAPDAAPVRTELAVPPNAPTRGARGAQVVIQEVGDYQCPFCAHVQPTVERLLREYDGRVRVVWRDLPLPFHTDAQLAAEAAREIYRQGGQARFWAYQALLFANQADLSRAALERMAQEVGGINLNQLRQALDTRRHQAVVEADSAATQAAGVNGTPGFIINGELVTGAQPYEIFEAAVERALAPATP